MNEKPKCPWCEEEFEPRTYWQRFCCKDHQQRWHRWREAAQEAEHDQHPQ
jgi:hypothetical protein